VIAAERAGRRCYAMELDPVYVDTAIRRWQALTGGKARHAASSRLFDDLAGEAEAANAV
jgi:DNA modification methylase